MDVTIAPPLAGGSPAAQAADVMRRHNFAAFGCTAELVVVGRPRRSVGEVAALLVELDRRFSRFVAGNELDLLNQSDGRWITVSTEMSRLLGHALRVAVESEGLVNIAVTNALLAAGYVRSWPSPWRPEEVHGHQDDEKVPTLTELLEVREARARLRSGYRLDFGAIAKGLWADDAVEMLGPNAAASLGGDVSARGRGPYGEGWPIGLPNGRTVGVVDGGVATSGTSKRRSGDAHHLIDPRTGRPSRSGYQEVTVLAGCGATAEWLATAALVGGPQVAGLVRRYEARQWVVPDTTTVGEA